MEDYVPIDIVNSLYHADGISIMSIKYYRIETKLQQQIALIRNLYFV